MKERLPISLRGLTVHTKQRSVGEFIDSNTGIRFSVTARKGYVHRKNTTQGMIS